jgi:uncharacterized phage protein (TIGR02216 family)
MSESFTDGAARLAGLVPRLFGWPPDAFWNATPAELAAILAPEAGGEPAPLSRGELDRLMERERDE